MRGSAAFAIVAAIAAYFVAPDSTPIDRALPFVVVLLSICGCAAVEDSGPPLSGQPRAAVLHVLIMFLLLPPIFLTDEHTRLLAYGLIAAITFAIAMANAPAERHIILVICGVLLLRWIPFSEVIFWREIVVLAGAIVVLLASRSPVLAIAVALFTPIFPRRAMLFPFLVGILFAILPRMRVPSFMRIPIYACAIALFAMWPWSGIVARALPGFLRAERPPENSKPVWVALGRGESVSIDAPPGARRAEIIASGANAAGLRRGTLMGTAEGMEIRIGDVADFGYTRREHFFASRNPAPRRPIDDVKGYGQSAWLHTAGLIDVPVPHGAIHVSAARDLPPNTRLQIEAVDFE